MKFNYEHACSFLLIWITAVIVLRLIHFTAVKFDQKNKRAWSLVVCIFFCKLYSQLPLCLLGDICLQHLADIRHWFLGVSGLEEGVVGFFEKYITLSRLSLLKSVVFFLSLLNHNPYGLDTQQNLTSSLAKPTSLIGIKVIEELSTKEILKRNFFQKISEDKVFYAKRMKRNDYPKISAEKSVPKISEETFPAKRLERDENPLRQFLYEKLSEEKSMPNKFQHEPLL